MYKFPVITNIEQVREAIKGREEFIEADKGDHIIFNYLVNFEDTFPPVIDEKTAILRECRGLIFDKRTGKVIARRYHKFFNLNEKPETQIHSINWEQPAYILEKLDGSMVTPFMAKNSSSDSRSYKIGTKMGDTDVAKNAHEFILKHSSYQDFIDFVIIRDKTPIFEWCSRKNRIVVDYPEDRLVLTAIRDNVSGEYLGYNRLQKLGELYDIEVVKSYKLSINDALSTLSFIKEEEGYVVRFQSGEMIKIKGEWYLQMHKTMEHIQLEKDLIRLILDDRLDDAKPFLPSDLVIKIDDFGNKIFSAMILQADSFAWDIIADFDNVNSKKQFAELIKNKSEQQIRFKVFDFMEESDRVSKEISKFVYELILDKVKKNLSSATKVDSIRHLIGNLKWEV